MKTREEINEDLNDVGSSLYATLDPDYTHFFKKWQKKYDKYLDLDIDEVEIEQQYIFEDNKNIAMIGSKKVANHIELDNMYDKDGIPIYDASAFIKTYVMKDKFKDKVFTVKNNNNPDISFASDGDASAGTNFIIHKDSYFVNNHRIVIQFLSNKYFSKYVYFRLYNMKKEYNFKRGFIPSQKNLKDLQITISIPKPYKNYTSYDIQKILVEFLEYNFNLVENYREKLNNIEADIAIMEDGLVPAIFDRDDDYIKRMFIKWNNDPVEPRDKKDMVDFTLEDIEFGVKRIHSNNEDDLVCKKRMGFTPTRVQNGDINWFTVKDLNTNKELYIDNPQTKEKTTINLIKQTVDKKNTGKSEKLIPIKKGDILISFKLTVGVVKIYNSDEVAYCNEAIDILTIKDGFHNKYIAYNCRLEYPKYGTQTNNGLTLNDNDKKDIKIFIPKPLTTKTKTYTSYEVQEAIVSFIDRFYRWKANVENAMKLLRDDLDAIENGYLYKTFKG